MSVKKVTYFCRKIGAVILAAAVLIGGIGFTRQPSDKVIQVEFRSSARFTVGQQFTCKTTRVVNKRNGSIVVRADCLVQQPSAYRCVPPGTKEAPKSTATPLPYPGPIDVPPPYPRPTETALPYP